MLTQLCVFLRGAAPGKLSLQVLCNPFWLTDIQGLQAWVVVPKRWCGVYRGPQRCFGVKSR